MKHSWANSALLLILLLLTGTGLLGLLRGDASAAWILIAHGIAAYALIFLFLWKSQIIFDAYRRKKSWTRARIGFLVLLILLVLTTVFGLVWTLDGGVFIGQFSLVSLHIYLAVPVMLLLVWHSYKMRFIFRVEHTVGRRLFFATTAATLAGGILWRSAEWGKSLLGWQGAQRRFTGSYETGSFSGRFPAVSWINDNPAPINLTSWQLHVTGALKHPLTLTLATLQKLPSERREVLLDCTSGWYTTQIWEGVTLRTLLAQTELLESAASITLESITRYQRRFDLTDLDNMLLAYRVADAPLSHDHGAPVRLVLPNQRGFEWVKWVTYVHINTTPALLQSPLPLR